MATVVNFKYPLGGALAPGDQDWWTFGPWDASFEGTVYAGAHPYTGPGSQYPQGITVTFLEMAVDARGLHYVNVIFKNTYSTHVAGYTMWLTVIQGEG